MASRRPRFLRRGLRHVIGVAHAVGKGVRPRGAQALFGLLCVLESGIRSGGAEGGAGFRSACSDSSLRLNRKSCIRGLNLPCAENCLAFSLSLSLCPWFYRQKSERACVGMDLVQENVTPNSCFLLLLLLFFFFLFISPTILPSFLWFK